MHDGPPKSQSQELAAVYTHVRNRGEEREEKRRLVIIVAHVPKSVTAPFSSLTRSPQPLPVRVVRAKIGKMQVNLGRLSALQFSRVLSLFHFTIGKRDKSSRLSLQPFGADSCQGSSLGRYARPENCTGMAEHGLCPGVALQTAISATKRGGLLSASSDFRRAKPRLPDTSWKTEATIRSHDSSAYRGAPFRLT